MFNEPLPENFDQLSQSWLEGEITGKQAADLCGMPLTSFRRKSREKKSCEGG